MAYGMQFKVEVIPNTPDTRQVRDKIIRDYIHDKQWFDWEYDLSKESRKADNRGILFVLLIIGEDMEVSRKCFLNGKIIDSWQLSITSSPAISEEVLAKASAAWHKRPKGKE